MEFLCAAVPPLSSAIRLLANMKFHGRDSASSLPLGQTMKQVYLIAFVAALIFSLQGQICNAALPETPTTNCNSSTFYKEGSAFEKNLEKVFDNLLQGTKQSGFNISVYGQSPDTVYGRLQCREDLTVDQCSTCSQYAITTVKQRCGNAFGASTWPFHCVLRYENYNFIGQLDTDLGSIYAEDFRGDTGIFVPTDLHSSIENLLKKLSAEAAGNTKRSALGTSLDSLSQNIYGLAQCTRDLSSDDCTTCLSFSTNKIFTSYAEYAGVQYWSQSCIVRYEIYPFYNSSGL